MLFILIILFTYTEIELLVYGCTEHCIKAPDTLNYFTFWSMLYSGLCILLSRSGSLTPLQNYGHVFLNVAFI